MKRVIHIGLAVLAGIVCLGLVGIVSVIRKLDADDTWFYYPDHY